MKIVVLMEIYLILIFTGFHSRLALDLVPKIAGLNKPFWTKALLFLDLIGLKGEYPPCRLLLLLLLFLEGNQASEPSLHSVFPKNGMKLNFIHL